MMNDCVKKLLRIKKNVSLHVFLYRKNYSARKVFFKYKQLIIN